jgi:DNA repair exonuclease SbcCD ATPase subunit
MEIKNLIAVTDRVIREYEDSLKQLDYLESSIEKNQAAYEEVKNDIALYEEVRVFLQELAEVARQEVASGLENIVTLCLQAVFGPTMSFEIDIDTSRNSTVIDFYVVNTDGEETVRFAPEESMGGGVVDTVAIGLRFGLLKILNPEPIGPIILDEPAKMVSGDLIDSIAALLQELTQMFDKQNILVTHHHSLMDVVDNAVYFEKINGVTKVTAQ